LPDQKLKISQRMTPTKSPAPPGLGGTWVAAGAINDAGDATAQVSTNQNNGHGTGTHTLTSLAGTLTLDEDVRIQPWPPPTPRRMMIEGTWKLIAATGAYAGLKARGKIYATVDRVKDPPEITFVRDSTP
jgi:hypothetical protein